MVCSVYVAALYRAAGVFGDILFAATELSPRDLYSLNVCGNAHIPSTRTTGKGKNEANQEVMARSLLCAHAPTPCEEGNSEVRRSSRIAAITS